MRTVIMTLALAVVAVVPARAAEFAVRPGPTSKVVFVSKAATETFEGKTDRLDGTIVVDPAAVGDSITVSLDVDMASLDTGIGKRNQHMRENHLETDTYPKAMFRGATVVSPAGAVLAPGTPVDLALDGSFTLHGVTRRMRATVRVTAAADGTLAFETRFKVPLADFGISRPKFLFLKLGEVQDVIVSGVAVPAGE